LEYNPVGNDVHARRDALQQFWWWCVVFAIDLGRDGQQATRDDTGYGAPLLGVRLLEEYYFRYEEIDDDGHCSENADRQWWEPSERQEIHGRCRK